MPSFTMLSVMLSGTFYLLLCRASLGCVVMHGVAMLSVVMLRVAFYLFSC